VGERSKLSWLICVSGARTAHKYPVSVTTTNITTGTVMDQCPTSISGVSHSVRHTCYNSTWNLRLTLPDPWQPQSYRRQPHHGAYAPCWLQSTIRWKSRHQMIQPRSENNNAGVAYDSFGFEDVPGVVSEPPLPLLLLLPPNATTVRQHRWSPTTQAAHHNQQATSTGYCHGSRNGSHSICGRQ